MLKRLLGFLERMKKEIIIILPFNCVLHNFGEKIMAFAAPVVAKCVWKPLREIRLVQSGEKD